VLACRSCVGVSDIFASISGVEKISGFLPRQLLEASMAATEVAEKKSLANRWIEVED